MTSPTSTPEEPTRAGNDSAASVRARGRWARALATTILTALALPLSAPAMSATTADARTDATTDTPSASAADTQLLLVHGYGDSGTGKDCNTDTWENALRYYQEVGGRARSSMTTIGYYAGDQGRCDVMIGDGEASNQRPIQDIAQDLAHYIDREYSSKGKPVNIVAHSMGGLVTRVALLGSAQGWDGFPSGQLDVDNVVTLSTPHQGVADPSRHSDRQWKQMDPDSGFMGRLHASGSSLGDGWADGTDWSLVGSREDGTVDDASGIDQGNGADQKYIYQDNTGDGGAVTHTGVRTRYGKDPYDLQFWHASGDHPAHHTDRGWSPLKTAYKAATRIGDDLPR